MGRRNEVYVMAPILLERQHDVRELFERDFRPLTSMADRIILAENTPEIAAPHEYGARAEPSDQWLFFTEMCAVARYKGLIPGFAETFLS